LRHGRLDIVVIVLVVAAVILVISAVKTVSQGYNYTVEHFGRLHQDPEARPQHDRPVRRSRRLQDEHDGDGAEVPSQEVSSPRTTPR
jgi:hypothetical protein